MEGLKTNNAPHSSVVVPHFIFGAIALLVVAILFLLSYASLINVYFNTKLVAITHVAVLGWATIIIFGALYQLIPVVFETKLYSEKLAKFTCWFTGINVLFFSYSFWIGSYTKLLPIASIGMFFALLLFVVNLLLTYKTSKIKNWSSKFIISAISWLFITEFIGTLIALNFKFNFLSQTHLHYLKIHATTGFIGWFLMLIIGVGSTLIPMFLISHQQNQSKLKTSFFFINSGILGITLNWVLFNSFILTLICWIFIGLGVLFFLMFIAVAYKNRMRKKLDIGMTYSMIAMGAIVVPIILSSLLVIVKDVEFEHLSHIAVFYGFSVLFGFITTLILGQTYKTLPFIVWLSKYKKLVGKVKTPLPRELYSEKIATIQFYTYLLFICCTTMGILLKTLWLLKTGSIALLLVAILYTINVLKIIFHTVKSPKNE